MSKVIVVDDDPTNTSLIKMLLELDGFSVSTCATIDTALAETDADTDAFVVDYHLARGSNGLELLRAVRSGKTAAAANAIVVITSGDYRREKEAEEAGANLFLHKPYPPDTLSGELNRLLGTKE